MKKILTFLFLAVTAMTFVSCNDDEIAATLDGVWEGQVSLGRWNSYQYVDIEFYRDGYSAGNGVEYDYQSNGTYIECPFTFKVVNGTIFMEYGDGSRVAIPDNYTLTETTFSGDFYEWVGNYSIGSYIAHFDFNKVTSWRHVRYSGYTANPDSTATFEEVKDTIK